MPTRKILDRNLLSHSRDADEEDKDARLSLPTRDKKRKRGEGGVEPRGSKGIVIQAKNDFKYSPKKKQDGGKATTKGASNGSPRSATACKAERVSVTLKEKAKA